MPRQHPPAPNTRSTASISSTTEAEHQRNSPPPCRLGVEPDDGVSAACGINMALVISLPIRPKSRLIAFSILR